MRSTLDLDAIGYYEAAGNIFKRVRDSVKGQIKGGNKLLDVAEHVEGRIIDAGAAPAFPCNISVNGIASHYTPSRNDDRTFLRGDLVKIDFGVCIEGYVADAAFTVEVDTDERGKLIEAAGKALEAGVASIKPGALTSDIGRAIERTAAAEGFHVLKDLLGHSLSRYCLHGGLTIPNYDDGSDMKVRDGDVLAIEPFVTQGSGAIVRVNGGNIYQLIRKDAIYAKSPGEKALLAYIAERFGSFPFAERWLPDHDGLQGLIASACVRSFPMMVESDGAPVAQAECTVIVERDGCRIIT